MVTNGGERPRVFEGLQYQSGFGNEFQSEAIPGALPKGQNNPQVRIELFEQFSLKGPTFAGCTGLGDSGGDMMDSCSSFAHV